MQQVLQDDLLSAAGVAKPIIFYDDVCVMCNGFVSVLLRVDRRRQFLFAPLGGETSRKLLPPLPVDPSQWSMIYVDESGIHDESDASLEVYRRALDSKPRLPSARPKSISLVWETRHVPPPYSGRESTISRIIKSDIERPTLVGISTCQRVGNSIGRLMARTPEAMTGCSAPD
jgi:predicted DCC family thiol-disulfide oxidoreductase YuxK